jgi:hypothetical protein
LSDQAQKQFVLESLIRDMANKFVFTAQIRAPLDQMHAAAPLDIAADRLAIVRRTRIKEEFLTTNQSVRSVGFRRSHVIAPEQAKLI